VSGAGDAAAAVCGAAGVKVLVAGIGNIFLGDDGFGCAVARRLQRCTRPTGLEIRDFGIRDLDLCYALSSSEFDVVILIDAIFRGAAAGSLQLMEPTAALPDEAGSNDSLLAMHALNPHRVLSLIAVAVALVPRLLILACEPQDLGGDAGRMGLSEPVQAAVAKAVTQIFDLVGGTLTAGAATQ
jgi:hydrogenase maturation protease